MSNMNPWTLTSYNPYRLDPLMLRHKEKRRIDKLNRKEDVCTKSPIHRTPKVASIKGDAHECNQLVCQHVVESV